MLKRRLLGTMAVASLVVLAACPPADQADRAGTDTIVPPPTTTTPPTTTPGATTMPGDTLMRDTMMMRDTLMRDTPMTGAPRRP
ncbi:MAG TPA: hypothetical protein VGR27_12170 [Longimicrobiaceae bacterium]|nr:hypothetical protein [Longimicrobiaceae bacterium]